MFLPIGDIPNPASKPYVTYGLIALNVAVYLLVTLPLAGQSPDLNNPLLFDYLRALGVQGAVPAKAILEQVSNYDLLVFDYGFRPAHPGLGSLFAAMFLHAGFMHLAGNMLFLWIFGDNVEHRFGRVNFLLAYLGTGIVATVFFALFSPESDVPMIGASGAISGVLGCYFIWFPRNQIKTFIFFFPFIMQTILIPARWVLGFYLVVDNLLPFIINAGGGGGGVAHGAHIGGFLGGLTLAFGLERWLKGWAVKPAGRGSARPDPAPDPVDFNAVQDRAETPGEQVARQLRLGFPKRAAESLLQLQGKEQRATVSASDQLAAAEYLLQEQRHDEALSLFRRFIGERAGDSQVDRAYLGAGKALMYKPRCSTSAYHYFLSGLDVARTPGVADELRHYIAMIKSSKDS